MKFKFARFMPASLGGRLVAGVALFTVVALAVTILVMNHLLERFVTGQIDQRLDNKIVALASQTKVASDGTLRIEGDADGPPFDDPKHRAFWRVAGPRNAVESRWLRAKGVSAPLPIDPDMADALPPEPERNGSSTRRHPRTIDGPGPDGEVMHMRILRVEVDKTPVTILAAAPQRSIRDPLGEALRTLAAAIVAVGVASLAAGFTLVRLTLRPLSQLRRDVADVRVGRRPTIPDGQPIEIKPLVDELNDLLVQNAATLVRARQHVANLAHGLKTPLATLSLGVARLEGEGQRDLAPLVDQIERRVRHHLARARTAALAGTVRVQTNLSSKLDDIVDALQKIYAEKRIAVTLACPRDLAVACEPQDLDEILGNLLENAFKYTMLRVTCSVAIERNEAVITIADDGPGLPAEEIARALRPGQRIDEQVPGFGFGLPIARELTELYAGRLTLAPLRQGLSVTLTLPLAPSGGKSVA